MEGAPLGGGRATPGAGPVSVKRTAPPGGRGHSRGLALKAPGYEPFVTQEDKKDKPTSAKAASKTPSQGIKARTKKP